MDIENAQFFTQGDFGKSVQTHYRQNPVDPSDMYSAYWQSKQSPNPLEKLMQIVKFLDPEKRINLHFEYDPDYPVAMCTISGFLDSDTEHEFRTSSLKTDSDGNVTLWGTWLS